jgi:hypothetical protein
MMRQQVLCSGTTVSGVLLMEYKKRFGSVEELDNFVSFHRNETGLCFDFDLETKSAWITVAENIARELRCADCPD